MYTYTLCIDQEVAWQSQFMHLGEHTYRVSGLIHGVVNVCKFFCWCGYRIQYVRVHHVQPLPSSTTSLFYERTREELV